MSARLAKKKAAGARRMTKAPALALLCNSALQTVALDMTAQQELPVRSDNPRYQGKAPSRLSLSFLAFVADNADELITLHMRAHPSTVPPVQRLQAQSVDSDGPIAQVPDPSPPPCLILIPTRPAQRRVRASRAAAPALPLSVSTVAVASIAGGQQVGCSGQVVMAGLPKRNNPAESSCGVGAGLSAVALSVPSVGDVQRHYPERKRMPSRRLPAAMNQDEAAGPAQPATPSAAAAGCGGAKRQKCTPAKRSTASAALIPPPLALPTLCCSSAPAPESAVQQPCILLDILSEAREQYLQRSMPLQQEQYETELQYAFFESPSGRRTSPQPVFHDLAAAVLKQVPLTPSFTSCVPPAGCSVPPAGCSVPPAGCSLPPSPSSGDSSCTVQRASLFTSARVTPLHELMGWSGAQSSAPLSGQVDEFSAHLFALQQVAAQVVQMC